ncbi:MAG: hypothetical protein ABL864_14300 [Terricaulis sp.]
MKFRAEIPFVDQKTTVILEWAADSSEAARVSAWTSDVAWEYPFVRFYMRFPQVELSCGLIPLVEALAFLGAPGGRERWGSPSSMEMGQYDVEMAKDEGRFRITFRMIGAPPSAGLSLDFDDAEADAWTCWTRDIANKTARLLST